MKRMITTALASLALWLPAVCGAVDNLQFSGALVAEPCVIPPGKEVVELEFGSVVDKYLYLNQRTPGVAFEIILADCDLSVGNTVKVTLSGGESQSLPGLLTPAAGSLANGIAIGLETATGQTLPVNAPSDKFRLKAGDNALQLKAYVQGEPAALAEKKIGRGGFSAVATFGLEYE